MVVAVPLPRAVSQSEWGGRGRVWRPAGCSPEVWILRALGGALRPAFLHAPGGLLRSPRAPGKLTIRPPKLGGTRKTSQWPSASQAPAGPFLSPPAAEPGLQTLPSTGWGSCSQCHLFRITCPLPAKAAGTGRGADANGLPLGAAAPGPSVWRADSFSRIPPPLGGRRQTFLRLLSFVMGMGKGTQSWGALRRAGVSLQPRQPPTHTPGSAAYMKTRRTSQAWPHPLSSPPPWHPQEQAWVLMPHPPRQVASVPSTGLSWSRMLAEGAAERGSEYAPSYSPETEPGARDLLGGTQLGEGWMASWPGCLLQHSCHAPGGLTTQPLER